MSRSYVPHIAALSLLWGASYMFIKVADRGFEPATMIMFRVIIASLLLTAALVAQRGFRRAGSDLRGLGWQGFGVGVANGAIPFTLIAWGERHIDSGVAAIANATVPIFVVLLALRWQPSEAVRGGRLGGILLGLVGSRFSRACSRREAGGPSPARSRSWSRRSSTRSAGFGASVSSRRRTASRWRPRR
jgi:drug/metabolite transporter (DMT)-like permease